MRMITHSYDSYDQAVRVVNALEAAGIPHDDISLVSGDQSRAAGTTTTGATTGEGAAFTDPAGAGTGATVGTVLGGGAGLLAGLGALAIPGVGPVVAAGWLIATLTGAGVGAAAGSLVGSLAGSGVDEADATHYAEHVGRGGSLVTVRASDEDAAQAEYIMEHGEARTTMGSTTMGSAGAMDTATMGTAAGMGMAGASTMAAADTTVTPVAAPMATARTDTTATTLGADDKLQVVKEDLVVGKREVEAGGVRVTSHVVETPVSEEVRLREERVMVDRRPVNRPLSGVAADAFRERTLQARATAEEAVVGKQARVVEEIGLRKEAAERTETVRDTVRETRVDVEQVPGTVTTGTTGVTGTTTGATTGGNTVRDNPATRAVDRTLNTNVSGENPKV